MVTEFCGSIDKEKLQKSKREMENIHTEFKQNIIKAFVYLRIVDEQSKGDPISYERIYEWSQDGNLIKLLREHEYNYMYIVHALEDFAGLYESTDLKEKKLKNKKSQRANTGF